MPTQRENDIAACMKAIHRRQVIYDMVKAIGFGALIFLLVYLWSLFYGSPDAGAQVMIDTSSNAPVSDAQLPNTIDVPVLKVSGVAVNASSSLEANVGKALGGPITKARLPDLINTTDIQSFLAGADAFMQMVAEDDGLSLYFEKDASDNGGMRIYTGIGSLVIYLTAGGNSYVNSNNFLVGTTSDGPTNNKLMVHSKVGSGSGDAVAAFYDTGSGIDRYTGILFSTAHTNSRYYGAIRLINTDTNYYNPRLGFYVQDYNTEFLSGMTEKVSILSNGNVGFATTNPTTKIEVLGNIFASGSITSNSLRSAKTDIVLITPTIRQAIKVSADALSAKISKWKWRLPEEYYKEKTVESFKDQVNVISPIFDATGEIVKATETVTVTKLLLYADWEREKARLIKSKYYTTPRFGVTIDDMLELAKANSEIAPFLQSMIVYSDDENQPRLGHGESIQALLALVLIQQERLNNLEARIKLLETR